MATNTDSNIPERLFMATDVKIENLQIVSGSSGFIGSHLIQKIINDGTEVLICRRDGNFGLMRENTLLSYADLGNWIAKHCIENFTFYHCATKFVRFNCSDSVEDLINSNFRWPLELVRQFNDLGNVHLVNLNSYWQAANNLIGMTTSNYAISKNLFYFNLFDILNKEDVTNIFLYDTYGPDDLRDKLIPRIHRSIREDSIIRINSPENEINLTHITDAIDFIHLLGSAKISGNHQLSHPDVLTIRELLVLIEKEIGMTLRAQINTSADIRPLRLPLEIAPVPSFWQHKIDLKSGLATIFNPDE